MRTLEEIRADVKQAMSISNAEALLQLSDELKELDTPEADALSSKSLGILNVWRRDYPAALIHFQRALDMHVELENRSGMAYVIGNIAVVYHRTGDYPLALEHYQRALEIHEEIGDRSGVALTKANIGNVYVKTSDYSVALEHFQKTLDIHEELGDRRGVAFATGSIGLVYVSIGDYPAALEHYQRLLDVHEELGNREGMANAIVDIGRVYLETGDYALALEHYQRALGIHEELGSRTGEARANHSIGQVYLETGDYAGSLKHFQRALDVHEDLGHNNGVARVIGNMASVLLKEGRIDEAITLLDQQANMPMEDPAVWSWHVMNRAKVLELMDDFEAAHMKYLEALEIVNVAGVRREQADYNKELRDLAQKRNDLAGYIEYNNEYTRITEEINGREASTKMAVQAKQREIDAERKEHEKQLAVLHSTLPKHIADRVARGETVNDLHENASVIFLDIVGFTTISDKIPSGHVVHLLEQIFTTLDAVCEKYGVVKIKTIGDSYMAVSFDSPLNAAHAALAMISSLDALAITMPPELGDTSWTKDIGDIQVRIGMHVGPVTAGVIGTQRMQYDVWGDTVNVASRMESSGEPGRIQVSEEFVDALRGDVGSSALRAKDDNIAIAERGEVDIKGKGKMKTFWLEGAW